MEGIFQSHHPFLPFPPKIGHTQSNTLQNNKNHPKSLRKFVTIPIQFPHSQFSFRPKKFSREFFPLPKLKKMAPNSSQMPETVDHQPPHSPNYYPSESGKMTDLLAQQQSQGIHYEPYHNDFKLCIYEEPNVQGRNERYEFRCDSHLSCCGRVCGDCPVEAFPIPLWLLLLLLFLALLLLLALLYLLYRLCCRKKRAEKEVVKKSTRTSRRTTRPYYGDEAGYRSIERDDDRERLFRDRASYTEMPNGHAKVEERVVEHQRSPFRRSFHEEETFEEEFHEEIEVEQGGKVAEVSSLDSRRI